MEIAVGAIMFFGDGILVAAEMIDFNHADVSGDSYDGEWKVDQRSGQGIYTFNNGDYFIAFIF